MLVDTPSRITDELDNNVNATRTVVNYCSLSAFLAECNAKFLKLEII